jgi:tetratricopeptide (TPR) repeat protein
MRNNFTKVILAVVCAAAAFAQAKQPKAKSQKELDALMAVQNATDPKARIAAIDAVLTKFADTEYKPGLLMMQASMYQQLNDYDNMIVYGERALEADPKSYQAMLILANAYVVRTKEFDLDKEDKLGKGEGYAKKALEELKTAEKPGPQVTDEQWTEGKKQMVAQAHEILGSAAMARKKYDVAVSEYKTAADAATPPEPATLIRLAAAYDAAGKPDEALPLIEKVMSTPDVHPQIKSVAQAERVRAMQLKNKGAAPAPAAKPATPTPAPASTTPSPAPTPTPAPPAR